MIDLLFVVLCSVTFIIYLISIFSIYLILISRSLLIHDIISCIFYSHLLRHKVMYSLINFHRLIISLSIIILVYETPPVNQKKLLENIINNNFFHPKSSRHIESQNYTLSLSILLAYNRFITFLGTRVFFLFE